MKQYINKSSLVAEIERLEKINQEYKKTWKWKFQWFYRTIKGRLEVLEGLKNYINSLEVKDVDLEKEIQQHIDDCLDIKFPTTDIRMIAKDVEYTARKFFELGLQAQKLE